MANVNVTVEPIDETVTVIVEPVVETVTVSVQPIDETVTVIVNEGGGDPATVDIEVNGAEIGSIQVDSGDTTLEINLTDGVSVVIADDVTLTGNTLEIQVPSYEAEPATIQTLINGTQEDEREVASGATEQIEVTVVNSEDTPVGVADGLNVVVQDSDVAVTVNGDPFDIKQVVAEGSETLDVPVVSSEDDPVGVITDGKVNVQDSGVTLTVDGDPVASIDVPAEGSIEIEITDYVDLTTPFEVNGVAEGTIDNQQTTGVDLVDEDDNEVEPISVDVVGNKRKIVVPAGATDEWVRPSDWLPMTEVLTTDQKFVGLHAIFEAGDNFVSILFNTSAGQYQVDWGDGSVTLHNSGVKAEYAYNYATYDVGNTTRSSRGYKQAIITVTPVSGNLTVCNLFQRYTGQNQTYSTGFLDCILSLPNATSSGIVISGVGTTTIRHRLLERFDIKNKGGVTSFSALFHTCNSLQSVPLFNTAGVTTMSTMFQSCSSLQSVPLFNTASVTNMDSMFFGCSSLQSVPLFNTASVTNMSSMFSGCSSLQSVPLFNTPSVTSMQSCFSGCSLLQSVPLFNTASVTNMISMFQNCISLQSVPLFNTASVTNMSSMFSGCSSLQSVPLFNTASVTNMSAMFSSCTSLQSVPLFNTASVTTMNVMFSACSSLKSIPAFNTSSITTSAGSDYGNWTTNHSLSSVKISFARQISLANGKLGVNALVEIFTNLVDRTSTTAANINITSNWGASLLSAGQRAIATGKNWTITG